jgi:hypothetical protein
MSAALSTVWESVAAIMTTIATTNTGGISFLVKRAESKDIKSSLVFGFRRLASHDHA